MTDTQAPEMSRAVPGLLALLAALFFLSGTSALIYQVLWMRLLGLVFGVTVYAASTVWGVFMAGLAIGSFIGGRAADRVKRPIIWFGIAEATIGFTALLTPVALDLLQRVYTTVHPSLNSSLTGVTFGRLALSFVVLIVPSALMGATLPLIVKSSLLRAQALGHRVGVLYATNTAGAIAGSLVAGLLLIPRFGISISFAVAVAINLVVASIALTLGRRRLPADAGDRTGAGSAAPPADRWYRSDWRMLTVLIVFAASGFISLALEVVWFRVLTLFLRPTVYAYSMMLAAVLAGIAAGSYAAAPWLRRRTGDWLLALALLEAAIAVAAVLSFAMLPLIPDVMAIAEPWMTPLLGEYLAFAVIVSFSVILPTMFLFGLAFPVGLHAWAAPHTDRAVAGSRIGIFYALNVAGAIAGSFGAGFLLLPALGSRSSLVGLGGLALLSAFALLLAAKQRAGIRLFAGAAFAAAFIGAVWITPDPFDAFLEQRYEGQQVLWRQEGVQGTVSVHRAGDELSLHVNGNHQASTSPGMASTHHGIGHLPLAVHPDPRSALVIGLGGGATAGAVSRHQGVDVDVVELSPEVVRAAGAFFREINYDVLRRPQVRLLVDDGRNHLLLTDRRYDVVTADVILPIHAGSGNLYSKEYFQLVRRVLRPGGVVLQWVAGTEEEYKLIMRTFVSVFPQTTVWLDGTLMVGSVEPLRLKRSDFEWKLDVPSRREALASIGLSRFEDLLAAYRAGPEEISRFVGEGPVLTDDRPLVEYFLSLPRDRAVDLSGLRGDVSRRLAPDGRP